MITTGITAFISFTSTNIDDIFVLMLFFSQTNNTMKKWHIIIGQYLGIGALITISIIGALGISVVPHEYVGFLGMVPIYLGIKAYVDHKKESTNNLNMGQNRLQDNENNKIEETNNTQTNSIIAFVKNIINPNIIKVFVVTFANGGDNIGIYIPLFASMSLVEIFVTTIIFVLLIALWCFIGLKLVEYPFVGRNIEKYKHILIPIIFTGLGIFILMQSGTVTFVYKKLF